MASQSQAAKAHRARQAIGPRVSYACPDFRMGDVRGFREMGREDLQHTPGCPNFSGKPARKGLRETLAGLVAAVAGSK